MFTMAEIEAEIRKILAEAGLERPNLGEHETFFVRGAKVYPGDLDSLDFVEVVMATEERFSIEIPDDVAEKMTTLRIAADYVADQLENRRR